MNKLNTKVEIRFHVASAQWIPIEVRNRLVVYQSNKISKEGDLILCCQEHRTQANNKKACMEKLKEMIEDAFIEPKDRVVWEGISERGKEMRKDSKRH